MLGHAPMGSEPINSTWAVPGTGILRAQVLAAGSTTPTGAQTRLIGKVLAGVVSPAGTLVRKTFKVLAGVTTPVGALIRKTYQQFAGTTTPTGALIKFVRATPFFGAISPSGYLLRVRNGVLRVFGVDLSGPRVHVNDKSQGEP